MDGGKLDDSSLRQINFAIDCRTSRDILRQPTPPPDDSPENSELVHSEDPPNVHPYRGEINIALYGLQLKMVCR